MRTGATILVTHVSGKRMIAQGADGVSCGSLKEGVCLGAAMSAFCPWGSAPIKSSPLLLDWIRDWLGETSELLKPMDWFSRGHDHYGGYLDTHGRWRLNIKPGIFIRDLPAVATRAALEELRKARTKRRKSTHLVVVPKLFTPLWLKQMYKVCNLVLFIPAHYPFWNESMFEPLCLGLCFPFVTHRPWQLRRCPKLLQMGRQVHLMCKVDKLDPRNILRELLCLTRKLPPLSGDKLRLLFFFERENSIPDKKRGLQDFGELTSKRRQASRNRLEG